MGHRLETALADTLMRLSGTRPAQQYAAEVVGIQARARGSVHRLAALADCELRAGAVDQAAATAERMLDTVQGMESHRLHDRLSECAGTSRAPAAALCAPSSAGSTIPCGSAVAPCGRMGRRTRWEATACLCGATSASAPCARTGGAP